MSKVNALEVLQTYRTRFYHWALHDIDHEVMQDYPIFRTYQSGSTLAYLRFVETLPLSHRLLLAEAFFKSKFARNVPDDLVGQLSINVSPLQTELLQEKK